MPTASKVRVTRTPIIGRSSRDPWPVGQAVESEALKAALAALPDPWRRVVILRDVDGRPAAQVSAATGLSAEQQRDVLNRARELLREDLGRALEQDSHRS
jgi:DNA-directed RNA polymerase specialized sigma24 family protein